MATKSKKVFKNDVFRDDKERVVRVLIVYLGGGTEKKVEIPNDSKITFGPALPGIRKNGDYGGPSEYALRVYKGATEKAGLLAVFTGVREFRENTIKVSTLVVREKGEEMWKSDENGYEINKKVEKTFELLPEKF